MSNEGSSPFPGYLYTVDQSALWVDQLVRTFTGGSTLRRSKQEVRAVDDISFNVLRGETFGLVGETGCGKSTVARCILRLIEPTAGRVLFEGQDIASLSPDELRTLRKRLQIVFQDPYTSLDPRMSALATVQEPLVIHGIGDSHERATRALDMLAEVGLSDTKAFSKPAGLSGGQRQRVGIARALVSEPEVVVLDEPLSALDVSVQAQVINLLKSLQRQRRLTYVFITHDLAVAQYFCDRIAVLYLGQVMELAERNAVFDAPLHPYTASLVAAIPSLGASRPRKVLQRSTLGEVGPGSDLLVGCPFEPRCPVGHDRTICKEERPSLAELRQGHWAACHFPGEHALDYGPTGTHAARGQSTTPARSG